jgi:phosphatidate cytidylyltransferase
MTTHSDMTDPPHAVQPESGGAGEANSTPNRPARSALRNRLFFGTLMMAGLLGLLWLDQAIETWTAGHVRQGGKTYGVGGVGILALLIILLPPAMTELATLFAAERVKPDLIITAIGAGGLVVHAFLTQFAIFRPIAASSLVFIIVFTMLLAALRRALQRQSQEAIGQMAGTVLAALYLGGLGWFLLALRVKRSGHFTGHALTILMILLMVKSTDIFAYFGGRAFGKHKLIPWLSPGKTWEGLACGLLAAGAVGIAFTPQISQLTWYKALIFGILIGAVGQLGDLFESMMKRDAEVKDSGRLIPGFGGILDVIDSPLLAAPFAYLLFSLF